MPLWVVKLGGSLFGAPDVLRAGLAALADEGGGRVVIVPGGGAFADQVRSAQVQWGLSDAAAHRMALAAMEQFGWLLADMERRLVAGATPDALRSALHHGAAALWLPYRMAVDDRGIPESWEVTSDSLAAWLAAQLDASHLLLVKSCALPPSPLPIEELASRGIVDGAFARFAASGRFDTRVLGLDALRDFRALLNAGGRDGTAVAGSRQATRGRRLA